MSVDEILVAVQARSSADEDPWSALLYAYMSRADRSDRHAETVGEILDRAVTSVWERAQSPALFGGFTGVAWLVTHLTEVDAEDDPNQEVDAALRSLLEVSPWSLPYDLVHGLVGIGVYFLERLKVPSGAAVAVTCLELIVERLAELANESNAGAAWFTPARHLPEWQRELAPRGYYNLGLAHGIPGTLALLGQICEAQVGGARARELLGRGVGWLLAQRRAATRLAAWQIDGDARGESRLAWCYGELGVSSALLDAARCVDEPRWEAEALSLARTAAAWRDETTGVRDAGLCHGTAGIAHIFNRMFQATGDASLREAALHWFERTLDLRVPAAGVAGYRAFRPGVAGVGAWDDLSGFLEGAAGVGLALLGAISDVEPSWDRLLLVSVRPALGKASAR